MLAMRGGHWLWWGEVGEVGEVISIFRSVSTNASPGPMIRNFYQNEEL